MALRYEHTGFDEAGQPTFTVTSDSDNPHFVLTGPKAQGEIVLADGSRVDVSAPVLEADDHPHALAIARAIGEHHQRRGTFGSDSLDLSDPVLDGGDSPRPRRRSK